MGKLIPRDLRTNPTSTAVWLASKRRDFIRNGGIAGLGPELQPNFDMSQGAVGWTPAGSATVVGVDDSGVDAVLITATAASTTSRAALAISGLEIGKNYRVTVTARMGAQGTGQRLNGFTWCTIPNTPITSATYQDIVLDVVATATSGESRVFATSAGGLAGDEVYCSMLSIREIL